MSQNVRENFQFLNWDEISGHKNNEHHLKWRKSNKTYFPDPNTLQIETKGKKVRNKQKRIASL